MYSWFVYPRLPIYGSVLDGRDVAPHGHSRRMTKLLRERSFHLLTQEQYDGAIVTHTSTYKSKHVPRSLCYATLATIITSQLSCRPMNLFFTWMTTGLFCSLSGILRYVATSCQRVHAERRSLLLTIVTCSSGRHTKLLKRRFGLSKKLISLRTLLIGGLD